MNEINKHIADLLMGMHGIDISQYDTSFLGRSLQKRITEIHCGSVEEYCSFLEDNKMEGKNFFDSLHISYSEFFRNPLTFAVLERIIVPSIVLKKKTNKRKEIRIWSAACAAGQEAYSIAILLEELKNGNMNKFDYRIFATDLCESQVDEARKGAFTAAALHNASMKRAEQWFTHRGETYFAKPELKEHIDFSVFDLFDEHVSSPPASIFGDFDLVFCANLLFYYKNAYRKIILDKITHCLASGGFLITGEAEREIVMKHGFHEVYPQSAIFQKKNGTRMTQI